MEGSENWLLKWLGPTTHYTSRPANVMTVLAIILQTGTSLTLVIRTIQKVLNQWKVAAVLL